MSGPEVKRRRAGLEVGPSRVNWSFFWGWLGLMMILAGAGMSFVLWIHDTFWGRS